MDKVLLVTVCGHLQRDAIHRLSAAAALARGLGAWAGHRLRREIRREL